jgi:DNA-binding beta-propeller fold protein YncE
MRTYVLAGLLLPSVTALASPLAFTPDGKALVAVSATGNLIIHVPPTSTEPIALRAHRGAVHDLAVSADGRRVVTAGADGVARVWDPKTWKEVGTLRGHDRDVYAVALSPDGTVVATAGADGTARLWDAATGRELKKLGGHGGPVRGVGFSSDGRFVYTGVLVPDNSVRGFLGAYKGDAVRRWDVATGKPADGPDVRGYTFATSRRLLAVGNEWMAAIPDGKGALSVGAQFSVALLTPRGTERATVTHCGTGVAFSPDGLYLVVTEVGTLSGVGRIIGPASHTRGLAVVDVFDGSDVFTLPEEVMAAAFSPDGRRLAALTRDGRGVRFIDLAPKVGPGGVADPEAAWAVLADGDAKAVHEALWALVGHGPKAVAMIEARIKPAAATPADAIARDIAALNSPKFADREAAIKALREAGPIALPTLKTALKDPPSAEARRRLEQLVDAAEGDSPPDPEARRRLRAIAILERINSPAAREVLSRLASGAEGAQLTTDAAAALARAKRMAGP